MLQVKNISYSVAGRKILDRITFFLNAGEKVALIGENGAGKTTLIRIIIGELVPDSGSVIIPASISYLPQEIAPPDSTGTKTTVLEFLLESQGLNEIQQQLKTLLARFDESLPDGELEKCLADYARAEEIFQDRGGYGIEAKIKEVLSNLKLNLPLDQEVSSLSGGQKSQLGFINILLQKSDLLILDEPTNHVDQAYYHWLGNYLNNLRQSVLVISHQPEFIDSLKPRLLELDKSSGRINEFRGSYWAISGQKEKQQKQQQKKIADLDKKIKQLEATAGRFHGSSPRLARQAKAILSTVRNLKAERKKIMESAAISPKSRMIMNLPKANKSSRTVITVQELSKCYQDPIFTNINWTVSRGSHNLIQGPNGAGKTTLMKILAGVETPNRGTVTKGENVRIGYYAQEHELLFFEKTVLENAQAYNQLPISKLRAVLGQFLFSQEKALQRVSTLSSGEKSRLALCLLFLGQFNVLLLDEPTNHLDQPSAQALGEALQQYDGTLIVISHDEEFLSKIRIDQTLLMPSGKIHGYCPSLFRQANSR